jgi:protein PhnA
MSDLTERAQGACELCGSDSNLGPVLVDSTASEESAAAVLACGVCSLATQSAGPLDGAHWYCLQEAVWSGVPEVQVLAYRLLHRVHGETWATDLLGQVYLEDDVRAWAERGLAAEDAGAVVVVDCHGAPLMDGDSVSLIKDLDVKGAGFTAKRGTLVKNIRLGDDPTHVEGKVNKVSIMLKTCFLKRSS